MNIRWRRKPVRIDEWEGVLAETPLITRLELYLRANIDGRRVSVIVPLKLLGLERQSHWLEGEAAEYGWAIEYLPDENAYRIESRQSTLSSLSTIEYSIRKTEGAALDLMPLATWEKWT